MSKIYRKRNDTTPLSHTLRENGEPADLSNATKVEFFMSLSVDKALKADGTGTVVDETSGEVQYSFSQDEVDEAGFFMAEWQVTYGDGTIRTYPNKDYLTVQISEDLA